MKIVFHIIKKLKTQNSKLETTTKNLKLMMKNLRFEM